MNFFSKLFAMLVLAMAAMRSEAFSGIQDGLEGDGEGLELSNFLCGNDSTLAIVQFACDAAGSYIGAQLDEVFGGGAEEEVLSVKENTTAPAGRKLLRGDLN